MHPNAPYVHPEKKASKFYTYYQWVIDYLQLRYVVTPETPLKTQVFGGRAGVRVSASLSGDLPYPGMFYFKML